MFIKVLFYYRKIGDSAIVPSESPSTIDPNNVLFLYVFMLISKRLTQKPQLKDKENHFREY
ncbi:hypothetical protein CJ306_11185 [Bacillus cereus]|nr:hypothetical protein CJ306_11185 [Bacillus cereus]